MKDTNGERYWSLVYQVLEPDGGFDIATWSDCGRTMAEFAASSADHLLKMYSGSHTPHDLYTFGILISEVESGVSGSRTPAAKVNPSTFARALFRCLPPNWRQLQREGGPPARLGARTDRAPWNDRDECWVDGCGWLIEPVAPSQLRPGDLIVESGEHRQVTRVERSAPSWDGVPWTERHVEVYTDKGTVYTLDASEHVRPLIARHVATVNTDELLRLRVLPDVPHRPAKLVTRPLSPRERFEVLRRDAYRCQLCGATAAAGATLEVDHIIPRARGGTNDPGNLWALCFACNRGKRTEQIV